MPRSLRAAAGDIVYHVFNRANARMTIFETPGDYEAFERVLAEGKEGFPMRIIDYCLMPNHWHLVLWPIRDRELSDFMHWLTVTHTQRWHAAHNTRGTGHIYQGRFKNFPVQSDRHYLTLCRYVERNALAAGLVKRAEDWGWGSLWHRTKGDDKARGLLSDGPLDLPSNWLALVNRPLTDNEEKTIENCIVRGQPFGDDPWTVAACRRLGLESTLRPRGRPKKRGQEPFPPG